MYKVQRTVNIFLAVVLLGNIALAAMTPLSPQHYQPVLASHSAVHTHPKTLKANGGLDAWPNDAPVAPLSAWKRNFALNATMMQTVRQSPSFIMLNHHTIAYIAIYTRLAYKQRQTLIANQEKIIALLSKIQRGERQ